MREREREREKTKQNKTNATRKHTQPQARAWTYTLACAGEGVSVRVSAVLVFEIGERCAFFLSLLTFTGANTTHGSMHNRVIGIVVIHLHHIQVLRYTLIGALHGGAQLTETLQCDFHIYR
jgi:hypothetical protein